MCLGKVTPNLPSNYRKYKDYKQYLMYTTLNIPKDVNYSKRVQRELIRRNVMIMFCTSSLPCPSTG